MQACSFFGFTHPDCVQHGTRLAVLHAHQAAALPLGVHVNLCAIVEPSVAAWWLLVTGVGKTC